MRPLLSGQYNLPAIYVEVDGVYTNTAPVDAVRGAGRPEATFLVERIVEKAARETGHDPAEFRRKNFVASFPHQTPVVFAYDVGDYAKALDKALELADYKGVPARKAASAAKGKLRGVGFSAYIEACGLAPSQTAAAIGVGVGQWESAEVRVNMIGTVEVLTGSHSHGQGHETTFAQLVSSRLGIPMENVSIVHGDTDKVQMGMGTYGSRSGAVGMSAIFKALDKIEAKAKKVAGHLLEAAEGDIEFKDGKFTVKGTDKSIDFASVATNAYLAHKFDGQELEPGLKESAFWDPKNFTYPAGVHICELEIDPQTGVVTIDRWTAVDDFGKLINPMIVEGQVHGGVAHGIGQALMEGAHYDDDGQLLTASYMDYCMPRADNLPSFKVDTIETPCPSNPLGIKGCGEAGAIASPPAVINAITDARRPRGRDDARDRAGRLARRAEGRRSSAPRNDWRRPRAASPDPSFGDFSMYAFEYHRPHTLSGALADLAKPDAKALAGGMTLLPTMKQRLAAPSAVIELKDVPELSGISRSGDDLVIGAMTRHVEVASNATVKGAIAALATLAGGIGDAHVRNRGTIGGSLANNDPAADYPAAALALGGDLRHQQAAHRGRRLFQGRVRDRARTRRAHHPGELPDPAKGGLYEIRQPRLALRAGRRVRRQDRGRRPRRGDRGGRERRLPLARARSRAQREFLARGRGRRHRFPQTGSTPTSTPTRTIAPISSR